MSLFNDEPAPVDPKTIPLAERMRPRSLDEIVGQDDLVAPGRPLREMIDRDLLQSIILWGRRDRQDHAGPPDRRPDRAEFVAFSAVLSGIKEVKDVMATAEQRGA
jgi:putative ATPase